MIVGPGQRLGFSFNKSGVIKFNFVEQNNYCIYGSDASVGSAVQASSTNGNREYSITYYFACGTTTAAPPTTAATVTTTVTTASTPATTTTGIVTYPSTTVPTTSAITTTTAAAPSCIEVEGVTLWPELNGLYMLNDSLKDCAAGTAYAGRPRHVQFALH